MSKKDLIALIVISAMQSGYRRAGFSLEQGKNCLTDVNEDQYHLLNDDPNLAVSVDEQASDIGSDKLPKTKTATAKKAPVKPTPDKKVAAK
jgi:FluMu-like protein